MEKSGLIKEIVAGSLGANGRGRSTSDLLSIYKELLKMGGLESPKSMRKVHTSQPLPCNKKILFTLKDGFHVQKISTVVGQYGTYIDAPIHFVEGGRWLMRLTSKISFLPLYVIDKSKEVALIQTLSLSKTRYLRL